MNQKHRIYTSLFWAAMMIFGTGMLSAAGPTKPGPDKSMDLIMALEKVNGGWAKLAKLKDVEFTYTYDDRNKKAMDISTERYIFDGEYSWGKYERHEVNAMPGQEGTVIQRFMKGKGEASLAGKQVTGPKAEGGAVFLRCANYYWFSMMYKLHDPGTAHKYLGTEEVNGVKYDKVQLSYVDTGKEVNDEYILYFNPETHLVDQFYFSLPAMGIEKPVMRMELEYEKIKGVYISTVRKGYYPDKKGEYSLGGVYSISDLSFKNGFTTADLPL